MATTVTNMNTWIGYRLGVTLSTSTTPTKAEVLQWINEVCEELLTVCVETGSEIGRTTGSITLADGDADYTDLAALMLAPTVMQDEDGNQFSAWIEKTNVRNPMKLVTEAAKIDYDPALESEPVEFYIDSSNTIYPLPVPDTAYTMKIPYYAYHTILTADGDTIPFSRIFDNVIIEAVTMRSQNRDEYDLGFELNWFKYIRGQARKMISMRRNPTVGITL